MSDPDVQRELEANRRRDEQRDGDDGSVLDTAESAINPLARVIRSPDEDDEESAESRRELNDEAQRPDE